MEIKPDHVFMHLIESAPFNIVKIKSITVYQEIWLLMPVKLSFQRGGEGYVSFIAKTKLLDHYMETLGAVHYGGHLMVITTETALKLIDKYF